MISHAGDASANEEEGLVREQVMLGRNWVMLAGLSVMLMNLCACESIASPNGDVELVPITRTPGNIASVFVPTLSFLYTCFPCHSEPLP